MGHQGTEEAESTLHICALYMRKTGCFAPQGFGMGMHNGCSQEQRRWETQAMYISTYLQNMVKKRGCIACRFEFKKSKCGRQSPKLAQ